MMRRPCPARTTALAALVVLSGAAACGGAGDITNSKPAPISGSYTLESYDGIAIPAHVSATFVIDTGYARLWPVGNYEIYARAFSNGSPLNWIRDNGQWAATDRTLRLQSVMGTVSIPVSADGRFEVGELIGTTHRLVFRRVGDATALSVRVP
jgi:hypothetical protein